MVPLHQLHLSPRTDMDTKRKRFFAKFLSLRRDGNNKCFSITENTLPPTVDQCMWPHSLDTFNPCHPATLSLLPAPRGKPNSSPPPKSTTENYSPLLSSLQLYYNLYFNHSPSSFQCSSIHKKTLLVPIMSRLAFLPTNIIFIIVEYVIIFDNLYIL